MSEDEQREDSSQGPQESDGNDGGTDGVVDEELEEKRATEDETISDSETCPECGAPIENLRATCPNCGYEYSDDDYDQPDAGKEFEAGTELDDSGEEVVDDSGKVESERQDKD
ncbi:MAG TPA: hypothetical protein VG929_09975 [Actinomycetota bacterium]|nr:hypothetical protein [Actinomycetota bacterium]